MHSLCITAAIVHYNVPDSMHKTLLAFCSLLHMSWCSDEGGVTILGTRMNSTTNRRQA